MTYDSEITNEVSSFCGQVKQITMAIKIGLYSVCTLDFQHGINLRWIKMMLDTLNWKHKDEIFMESDRKFKITIFIMYYCSITWIEKAITF